MTLETHIRLILNTHATQILTGCNVEAATEQAADAILAHLYPAALPPQLPISDALGDDCSPR